MVEEIAAPVVAPAEAVVEKLVEAKEEPAASEGQSENPVEIHAQRYAHIEALDSLFAKNGYMGEEMLGDVNFCRGKVMQEIALLSFFAPELGVNTQTRKAVDVLQAHLNKCYDRITDLRDRILNDEKRKKYISQATDFEFSNAHKLQVAIYHEDLFRDDDIVLLGEERKISLDMQKLGLPAGIGQMVSQMDKSPSKALSAWIPDVATELISSLTGVERKTVRDFFQDTVKILSAIKNPKSMNAVLEGVDAASNIIAKVGAMSK